MAKNVEYEIKLGVASSNAATLKGLRDQVAQAVKQMEADFARLGKLSVPTMAGVGSGGAALGSSPSVNDNLGFGASGRFSGPASSGGSRPGGAVPSYDEQLQGLKDLEEELGKVGEGAEKAGEALKGVGDKSRGGLDGIEQQAASVTQQMAALQKETDGLRAGLSKNTQELTGSVDAVAGGLGKLASGIAFLSAGNEDIAKLINTLLTIKGTVEVFTGISQAVTGVVKTFSLFGDRAEMTAKATQANTEKQKLAERAALDLAKGFREEAKASEAANGALDRQAKTANRLAAELEKAARASRAQRAAADGVTIGTSSRGPVSRRGVRTSRTPGGGGVRMGGADAATAGLIAALNSGSVGEAVKSAGLAGAEQGIGSLVSRGVSALAGRLGVGAVAGTAMTTVAGSGLGGAAAGGLGAAGAGALGGLAALAVPAAAAGAALGSLALVGKQLHEIYTGQANEVGSVTDTIATWEVGLINNLGLMTGAFDLVGDAATKEAEKRLESAQKIARANQLQMDLAMVDRTAQRQVDELGVSQTQNVRSMQVANRDMTAGQAAGMNAADAAKALGRELKIVKEYQDGLITDEQLYVDALEQAQKAFDRLGNAQREVIAGVKAETAERKAMNASSISAAEQRLGLLEKERGIFQTSEQKLEAAAVKFAELSKQDQADTLKAQSVAQSGGKLSKRQRGLLDGLGLGQESEVVKQQQLQQAGQGGFFQSFGSFEQSQMAGSARRTGQISQLQMEGQSIDPNGDPKTREAQLRDLQRRQGLIGEAQDRASGQTSFNQRPSDAAFDRQAQSVKVELANRREFDIKIQADSEAIIRDITAIIQAKDAEQRRYIKQQVEMGVGQAKKELVEQARQAELAKRNSR